MFCSNCGTKNSDNAVFCEECGYRMNAETAAQTNGTAAQAAAAPQQYQAPQSSANFSASQTYNPSPDKPGRKAKPILIVLISVIAVAVLAAAAWLFLGKSGFLSAKSAEGLSAPEVTATAGNGFIALNWETVDGAETYRVFTYDKNTKKYTLLADVPQGTGYTIKSLKNGTSYVFLVRAGDGTVWSPYTSENLITAQPAAPPAAPKVKAQAANGTVTLTWETVSSAVSYKVYAYDTAKKTYTLLATVK